MQNTQNIGFKEEFIESEALYRRIYSEYPFGIYQKTSPNQSGVTFTIIHRYYLLNDLCETHYDGYTKFGDAYKEMRKKIATMHREEQKRLRRILKEKQNA